MNEIKPFLAIETSGSLCSVCAYFNEEKYFELNISLKHSHAERLFILTDQVVALSQVNLKDYEGIAVSSGPGSFTGLRIGMSAAKGLALGANLPIYSVPTFEALALHISNYLPEGTEFAIAVKVNTLEIYFARFYVKSNNYIFTENLQIITYAEFLQKTKNLLVFGNTGQNSVTERITAPPGSGIARWARLNGKGIFDYDFIEPNYMKNFIIKEKKK
jgi:tRNA threonylcarbamoyladenosine biosynthesis protein TsaB